MLKRFGGFKDGDFVNSLDAGTFTAGKVYVGFRKNQEICPVYQSSLEGDYGTIGYCDEVYIAYRKQIPFLPGLEPVVEAVSPILNLRAIRERCDPFDHNPEQFPCDDEDA